MSASFLARLGRRFSWGADHAIRGEAYIAGENLTDRNFAYQPGYPLPGINYMIGLRFER